GKLLEPVALQMAIEDYGLKVTKRSSEEKPNRYTDPEHDFLRAEVDFEFEVTPELADHVADHMPTLADHVRALVGTVQNGEVRSVHAYTDAKFGGEGPEDTPIEYAAQAVHGLMVPGRQLTLFVVVVGADNLSLYFVRRDEDPIRGMR